MDTGHPASTHQPRLRIGANFTLSLLLNHFTAQHIREERLLLLEATGHCSLLGSPVAVTWLFGGDGRAPRPPALVRL